MLKDTKIISSRPMPVHRTGPVYWGWYVVFSSFIMLTLFSTGIGGALGPIIGGFIFDKTGSYRPGWIMNTVFLLVISLLILHLIRDGAACRDDSQRFQSFFIEQTGRFDGQRQCKNLSIKKTLGSLPPEAFSGGSES